MPLVSLGHGVLTLDLVEAGRAASERRDYPPDQTAPQTDGLREGEKIAAVDQTTLRPRKGERERGRGHCPGRARPTVLHQGKMLGRRSSPSPNVSHELPELRSY